MCVKSERAKNCFEAPIFKKTDRSGYWAWVNRGDNF